MAFPMSWFDTPGPSGSRRRRLALTCLAPAAAVLVPAVAPMARADDQVFTPNGGTGGTVGDFSDPNNWFDPVNAGNSNVPGSADRADIASATDTTNATTLLATLGAGNTNPAVTVN